MKHENIEKIKGSGQYFSLMAILGIAVLVWSVSPALAAVTSPTLGNASSYAILGKETVTNTGSTVVIGDLGVFTGSAVTGFPPGIVISGTIHAADANAHAAQDDNTAAYLALSAGDNAGCTTDYGHVVKILDGLTLVPGVYCADSFQLTSSVPLTLDDTNNASGVWIFRSELNTLITTPGVGASVVFLNGIGSSCNVWWKVHSSATIGSGTKFIGNILASTSISLGTLATLDGRALAQTGAVTMDSNKISPSTCGVPNALKLTKTASLVTYHVGETIAYDYRLQNTGTNVLDGPFNVSDDKVTVTCPGTPTSLNTGESIICSASYSVIQADLDAGSITNTANATAENNAVTSNQDQVTVTVTVTGQGSQIPEFPTVALPVIAVIGLLYMFQRRKGK